MSSTCGRQQSATQPVNLVFFCSHKQVSVLADLLLSFAITSLRICAHGCVCVCAAVEIFFSTSMKIKSAWFSILKIFSLAMKVINSVAKDGVLSRVYSFLYTWNTTPNSMTTDLSVGKISTVAWTLPIKHKKALISLDFWRHVAIQVIYCIYYCFDTMELLIISLWTSQCSWSNAVVTEKAVVFQSLGC